MSYERIVKTQSVMKRVLLAYMSTLCAFQSFGAIDIIFDYTYDTSNWFGDEQRYIMDQAAYAFESRLGSETFGSLNPSDYAGTSGNYYLNSLNPVSGQQLLVNFGSTTPVDGARLTGGNTLGLANTITIFPGAGAASGSTLAWASGVHTGTSGTDSTSSSDKFVEYLDNVRDTISNYDSVGGTISVNHSYNWYFDTDLTDFDDTTGKFDFYSVMVHEIGHLMGFRDGSDAWDNNYSANTWVGAFGVAANSGNPIPMDAASQSHFNSSELNSSHVGCACHPIMDVSSGTNERGSFTELDFAVLKDIGYSISASPSGGGINDGNTYTDPDWGGTHYIPIKEDYGTWLARVGSVGAGGAYVPPSAAPEPAYIFSFMGGFIALLRGRKKIRKIKSYLLPSFP